MFKFKLKPTCRDFLIDLARRWLYDLVEQQRFAHVNVIIVYNRDGALLHCSRRSVFG